MGIAEPDTISEVPLADGRTRVMEIILLQGGGCQAVHRIIGVRGGTYPLDFYNSEAELRGGVAYHMELAAELRHAAEYVGAHDLAIKFGMEK